jgi:hypothetical protein
MFIAMRWENTQVFATNFYDFTCKKNEKIWFTFYGNLKIINFGLFVFFYFVEIKYCEAALEE